MKPFDGPTIRRYVPGGEPLDKAGACAVYRDAAGILSPGCPVLSRTSSGLPLERLRQLMTAVRCSAVAEGSPLPPVCREYPINGQGINPALRVTVQ
jgi:predicted house-cleaning NTP pyrophosphatase (Maf/HAM1 superfamily)